jgi:hypothetical protein
MLEHVDVEARAKRPRHGFPSGPCEDLIDPEVLALGMLPVQKGCNDPDLIGDLD